MELIAALAPFAVGLVCMIGLTIAMGSISSALHPACSSMDFADNDAYYAHLERRDRFFREEHVGMAGLNTVITYAVLTLFGWSAFIPAATVVGVTFLTWCLLRLCIRRSKQMILWDSPDKLMLLAAMAVGVGAGAFVVGSLGTVVLAPAAIFFVCWLLLFPL